MASPDEVTELLRGFLKERGFSDAITHETELYENGLGLESLEAAELSALLDMKLGSDPYTAGEIPQTVGDILRFYAD